LAKAYFDGSIVNTPVTLAVQALPAGSSVLHYNTLRGLYYCLQSTSDLTQPFTNEPPGFAQAVNSTVALTNGTAGPQKFYRITCSLTP
jgi:hypothetical protein